MDIGGLNPGPLACIASPLLTGLSSQLHIKLSVGGPHPCGFGMLINLVQGKRVTSDGSQGAILVSSTGLVFFPGRDKR